MDITINIELFKSYEVVFYFKEFKAGNHKVFTTLKIYIFKIKRGNFSLIYCPQNYYFCCNLAILLNHSAYQEKSSVVTVALP